MQALYRAATAALVLSCAPIVPHAVLAAELRPCATPESVEVQVRASSAKIAIRHVAGLEAVNLSAGISAATGTTVPQDSEYLLVHEPGSPLIYLVQFAAGCAAHHGRFPEQLIQAWIKGAAA